MKDPRLTGFVRESNRIEGILSEPTLAQLAVTEEFLGKPALFISDLIKLVAIYAPGHAIRDKPNLNVRVGRHVAPSGGLQIINHLDDLLAKVNQNAVSPWHSHVAYELLHPFSDGNGRSGRALWAWHMLTSGQDPFSIPFLHRFYYQTLSCQREV